jgi:hypothetical protein
VSLRAVPHASLGKRLELLARLETDSLPGQDIDFGPCPRISADTSFARFHVKHPEAPQLYPFTSGQSLLHRLKYGLHRRFSFGLGNACPIDHIIDEIELDHRNLLKMQDFILETPSGVVKLFSAIL